jgi:hypothetical protein
MDDTRAVLRRWNANVEVFVSPRLLRLASPIV